LYVPQNILVVIVFCISWYFRFS